MNNVSTINLPVSTFGNIDDILVNASGSAGRIKKADFLGAMNDWSNVTNKPFEDFDNTYFRTKERADGADLLTFSDSVIAYFQAIGSLQNDLSALDTKVDENYNYFNGAVNSLSSGLSGVASNMGQALNNTNARVTTLESSSHSHSNIAVLDLFSTSNDKLFWNGSEVGSGGGGQGLDFSALSTAMTTGTQSGISVTADTENERFNFEVTGIPTIAIDSEGYWTINGERGANPTKAQGENGNNGADGISPTAVVTDTGDGATISITDKNGTTTANIYDGTDGISPHIDEITNHWFIGETDTGVNATAGID